MQAREGCALLMLGHLDNGGVDKGAAHVRVEASRYTNFKGGQEVTPRIKRGTVVKEKLKTIIVKLIWINNFNFKNLANTKKKYFLKTFNFKKYLILKIIIINNLIKSIFLRFQTF